VCRADWLRTIGARMARTLLSLLVLLSVPRASQADETAKRLPSAREMAEARQDVWGEAALRQPGEPSYEFFVGIS
jgi:hypothetical protein